MVRVSLPGKKSRSVRQRLLALAGPKAGLVVVATVLATVAFLVGDGSAPAWRAGAEPAATGHTASFALATLGLPDPAALRTGPPTRSAVLAGLGMPPPGSSRSPARAPRPPARRKISSGHLSPYDDMIRRESERLGLDWRLIAALMYEESQFDPRAQNRSGARGLMQVMPSSAGVPADSLWNPLTNLQAGLRIFHASYRTFAELDSLDRIQFTVAAYNAGMGRILDARRIALESGQDPDRWQGSVADAFLRLADPRWRHLVKHGHYPGIGTVRFVDETLERYERYAERVDRAGHPAGRDEDLAAVSATLP